MKGYEHNRLNVNEVKGFLFLFVCLVFFFFFQNPYILILTHCRKNLQENIVVKDEIAQNEQFHLFPQCFLCSVYLKILK